jgi:hypothetical protein
MTLREQSCRRYFGAIALAVTGLASSPAAARADDIVLRWNQIAAQTATATNPFNQARVGAIVQLAVFEAVNAFTGEYEPYLDPATTAPAGASMDAAVIIAAHRTLTTYLPAAMAALDAARDADLALIPDGQAKTEGMAVGMAAADAMIALRANDGSSPLTTFTPTSNAPGDYQLTVACTAGLFYNWQNVTPFAIGSAEDYLLDPPPHLGSNLYAKDYYEVKTLGAIDSTARTAERAENARFYHASSPSFLLSMAVRQMSVAKGMSPSENARVLALMQMAINDALVASFMNKYHHNLWRPETGIRSGASDGNNKTDGAPGFLPFIPTPCFPAYPSNHASGSNAGLEVLRRVFGAAGHDITFVNNVPALRDLPAIVVTKHYSQLKAISDDVDDARVYGGIHWRFDQVAGHQVGRTVATEVVKNSLRAVHP